MSTLFLVATPIGNLEDMSPRAVRTLQEVALIAAEDTRVTRHLLTHFGVATPLVTYTDAYQRQKEARQDRVLQELAAGHDVALVSDAGTPGVSDPGYQLVQAALAAGHAVQAIPGPSAVVTALAASGLPSDRFLFVGFLPRRAAERRLWRVLRARENPPAHNAEGHPEVAFWRVASDHLRSFSGVKSRCG